MLIGISCFLVIQGWKTFIFIFSFQKKTKKKYIEMGRFWLHEGNFLIVISIRDKEHHLSYISPLIKYLFCQNFWKCSPLLFFSNFNVNFVHINKFYSYKQTFLVTSYDLISWLIYLINDIIIKLLTKINSYVQNIVIKTEIWGTWFSFLCEG